MNYFWNKIVQKVPDTESFYHREGKEWWCESQTSSGWKSCFPFLFFFLTSASHFRSLPLTHFLSAAPQCQFNAAAKLWSQEEDTPRRVACTLGSCARTREKERKRRMEKAQQPVWFIDRVALGLHRLPLRQDASLVAAWTGTLKEFSGV